MAKQLKRMNYGGSSTGFNAKTGSKMTPSPGRGTSGVDNSNTNTTQGQIRNFKKGGTTTKTVTTLKRRK